MRKQLFSVLSVVSAFSVFSCSFALTGCSAGVEPSTSASGSVSAEAFGDGGATAKRPPMIGFADLVRSDGTEPLQLPFLLPDPHELGAPPAPQPATAKGEMRTLLCRTLPEGALAMAPPPPPSLTDRDAAPPNPPGAPPGSDGTGEPADDSAGTRPPPGLEIVQVAVFDHGFDAKSDPKARPDFVVECLAPPGDGPLALPQNTIDEIAAHGGGDAVARVAVARFGPPPPPPGAADDADTDASRPPPPHGRGVYAVVETAKLSDSLAALAPAE